jgi:hypothetical protein
MELNNKGHPIKETLKKVFKNSQWLILFFTGKMLEMDFLIYFQISMEDLLYNFRFTLNLDKNLF